jgi:hypothetical protein
LISNKLPKIAHGEHEFVVSLPLLNPSTQNEQHANPHR